MGLVASWHLRQPSHINQWCCSYCVSLAGALAIIFMMVTATTFFSFRNFGKLYKPKIPFFWWWSLFHYIQSWLNQPPHQSFPRAGPRPTSQPRRAGAVWKHHPPSFPQRVPTFKSEFVHEQGQHSRWRQAWWTHVWPPSRYARASRSLLLPKPWTASPRAGTFLFDYVPHLV